MQRIPDRRADGTEDLRDLIRLIDARVGNVFPDNGRVAFPKYNKIVSEHQVQGAGKDDQRFLRVVYDRNLAVPGMGLHDSPHH